MRGRGLCGPGVRTRGGHCDRIGSVCDFRTLRLRLVAPERVRRLMPGMNPAPPTRQLVWRSTGHAPVALVACGGANRGARTAWPERALRRALGSNPVRERLLGMNENCPGQQPMHDPNEPPGEVANDPGRRDGTAEARRVAQRRERGPKARGRRFESGPRHGWSGGAPAVPTSNATGARTPVRTGERPRANGDAAARGGGIVRPDGSGGSAKPVSAEVHSRVAAGGE